MRTISPPENKVHYPAIDGLRAVAIFLVFSVHYLVNVPPILGFGWIGVDIFFVLSGFLITGILYDTKDKTERLKSFYMRRALRIFPLYYGILILALVSWPVMHWNRIPGWPLWFLYLGNFSRFIFFSDYLKNLQIFENLTSAHGFVVILGPFWSLCIEEQFYLVWPFVVYAVRDRIRLRNLCAAVVIVTPLLRIACLFVLPSRVIAAEFLYRCTPLRCDSLLLGGLVALCLRGPEAKWVKAAGNYLAVGCGSIFFIAISAFVIHTHHAPSPSVPWIGTIGFTIVDLASAGIVLIAIQSGTLLNRILTVRWLCWIGTISYGIYVYHDLLRPTSGIIAHKLFGTHVTHYNAVIPLVGMVLTLLVAYGSFRLYESPLLRLKRFFIPGDLGKRTVEIEPVEVNV